MTRVFTPASPVEAPRLARRKHGRHVVVAGVPPTDWSPTDPGDVPPEGLTDPEPLAAGLTLAQAIAEVRVFNRTALADHTGLWAVIIFRPKCAKEVRA